MGGGGELVLGFGRGGGAGPKIGGGGWEWGGELVLRFGGGG